MKKGNTVVSYLILLLVVTIVSWPVLISNYTLSLDQIAGPQLDVYSLYLYGFQIPTFGGSVILRSAKSALSILMNATLAESIYHFVIILTIGITSRILSDGTLSTRIFATILFLFNPFVYSRLLVGHWFVLWGLAMLPLVFKTYTNYLEEGGYRNLVFIVLALTLLGFSAHLLFAATFLVGFLSIYKYVDSRDCRTIKRTLLVPTVAIPINVYWLAPVFLSGGKSISKVTAADQSIYAPQTDIFTALYSTASMHGFWRGAIRYATDLIPVVGVLFVPILFLAVHGFTTNYDHPERGYIVKALATTWVVALLLGAGASGPAAPIYAWLFENVPFFAGMRDSNKFVALIVLAYAYLGALGFEDLLDVLPDLDTSRLHPANLLSADRRPDARTLVSWALVVALLLTPIVYNYPMVTGYDDQINSQDYPEEWYEVKEFVDSQPGDSAVLFLPWHLYMDYSWLESEQKRIATPARAFFERPVIQGDNVQAGPVYSTSSNPVSQYVQFLFGSGPRYDRKEVTNMGELLTHIDVEYVLVTKEADWHSYDALLRNQTDLTLAMENDYFRVYRNDRKVNFAYTVNRVTYVANRTQFLERSRTEDTTESIYVLNETRAGETTTLGPSQQHPVSVKANNPASYRLENKSGELTVFTQRQATYADDWRTPERLPKYRHLGFTPVFESNADSMNVRHAAFYELYLPSYLFSLLSVVALIGYGVYRSRFQEAQTNDD